MAGWHVPLMLALLVLAYPSASAAAEEAAGEPPVITAGEALELVTNSGFNPLLDCNITSFRPANNSFLGRQQLLRTGDVLQAFYRFRRDDDDCNGSAAGAAEDSTPLPPLIMLPGIGLTVNAFGLPLLATLSCGREVIALENRGGEPLTSDDMPNSVLELIEALNLTRPDIFGWSMGGGIALRLAALHGDQVGRIITYGSGAANSQSLRSTPSDVLSPSNFGSLSQVQQLAIIIPPQLPDFEEAACAYAKGVLSMPDGLAVGVNDTVYERQYALARAMRESNDTTLWDALPDIENPVLLVQGALDVIAAPANAARAAERIPGAELVVLPDWGHMVKGPQEFAAIVGDFLSAHALSE